MRKAIALLLFVSLISSTFLCTNAVMAEEAFPIDAKSAVLMDAYSGNVLLEKNKDDSLPPASVTKVMTILLVYEALRDGKIAAEDVVSISEHAASMGGSQVFLEPSEQQTVATLLKCVVVASANDAAVALAEKVSGSEEAFVALMNERAKELGMNNTNFVNACGLDAAGHTTSAYDIGLMTKELIINFPQVFETAKIWQDTITHVTRRGSEEFGLTNTNKLLKLYPSATGLKTGSTGDALFCLSATAAKGDMQLIAVIMGSPTSKIRFQEAVKMFDNGFANYGIVKGDSAGTKKGDVIVYKGERDTAEAVIANEVRALVKKGQTGEIQQDVRLLESINAPVEKGAKLGEVVYKIGDKEVGKSELVAADSISKLTFFGTIERLLEKWVS